MSYLLGFLEKGGMFMYIILTVSIFGVAIIIERSFVLWARFKLDVPDFVNRISSFIASDHYSRAIELCNSKARHPLTWVIKAGLLKANKSDKEIQRSMEEAMLKAVPTVQKRTGYLAMIANVSTLLGLLGTIQGLIQCFEGVVGASAAEKQEALAIGISIAMYTTFFGLVVAIPVMIIHSLLKAREGSIIEAIEESSVSLLGQLSLRNREALTKEKRAA